MLTLHEAIIPIAFGLVLVLFHDAVGSQAHRQQATFHRGRTSERLYQRAFLLGGVVFVVAGVVWLLIAPGPGRP